MTLAQSGNHIVESRNSHTAYFRQLLIPAMESLNFHRHRLCRGARQEASYLKSAHGSWIRYSSESMGRPVHGFHVITAHHAAGRIFGLFQFRYICRRFHVRSWGSNCLVNAECRLQLQVRPVIQKIAESARARFSHFLKFSQSVVSLPVQYVRPPPLVRMARHL